MVLYFLDQSPMESETVREKPRDETPMDSSEPRPGQVQDADPTYYWGRGNVMEGEQPAENGKVLTFV